MQALIDFFGINNFIPHGYCLSWSPVLLWMHVISDLLIALAYFSIPLTLVHFIRQRQDVPYSRLVIMFAGFIVACGAMHLLAVITIWIPLYWLDGLLKSFIAVFSIATAVLMLRIIPQALSMPSTAQLHAEIQQRKTAEEALRVAHAALQQNSARTQLLLDSALDGIISMDHHGNIMGWNGQAEHIFGYSSEQALGRKIADLIVPPAYREQHQQGLSRFVTTGESNIIGMRLEIVGMRADASEFPMELAVDAVGDKDDYFFSAYVRDISERKQAETAQQEALDKLRKIAAQLPGVIFQFRLRPDGHPCLPYVSDVLCDLYRIDPEEVKEDAAKVFAVVHPDDLAGHLASIQESAHDLRPWRNEYRLRFADGTERWLFGNALPQREEDGAVVWHGFVTDITERKQMEDALRESEFRWKFAIEGSGDGLWDWDVANGTVFFSKRWKEMLGFTEDEIGNGLNEWSSRIHPDDKSDTLVVVQDYFNGKIPVYMTEHRMLCKDGSYKWILDRGIVVSRDAEGKPLRMIGTHTDITEHKQMEEKLRDSDVFNASILNSLTSHIAVLDANGIIVAVNSAWRQFAEESGLSPAGCNMLGRRYIDACENACGEGASPTQAGIMAVLRGELESFHLEYPCRMRSQLRWFHMTVLPLQGSRRGVVVSHKNITERKKAEEAVQAASQYARSLIEASLDPLVTISADGKVTDVNTATEQVTGVNRDNLIGSDFADYFTDPEKARAGYQQVFSQGFVTDYPLAIRHVSGKVTDVLYNASVYRDGNGNVLGVFAAARDITERKIMEDELKNREEKFRSIIEVSPVPMALNDEQLNITFLNPAFVQTFGYIVADIPTVADWRLKAFPDPDYRRWIESNWQTTLAKAKQEQADLPSMEVAVRCKDNTTKTVLVTAAAIHDDIAGMRLVVLYDITQRKQIEAELIRSNADLEQFAYAVSHDMRQPLRMVSSYLSLIESALAGQLDEETQQFLGFAVDGAKRMDAMILSLLDYSRIGRKFEAKTWISSKASLDEALAFLNPELNTCGGEINVTGEWPELFASRDELTRLLQNLIGNALKYHEENQAPEVHVHGSVCGESFRVEVRDHGIGIEPSQLDRLFKVFSRLQARSRFEGTGVGLALCRRIVEHHDGSIGVESAGEGQGCLFWFELPVVNAVNPVQTDG